MLELTETLSDEAKKDLFYSCLKVFANNEENPKLPPKSKLRFVEGYSYLVELDFEQYVDEGLLTQEELSLYAPLIEEEEENNHLKYDLEFQTLGILLSGSLLEKHQSYIEKNKIKTIQENTKYLNKNLAIVAFINKIKLIKCFIKYKWKR